MKFANGLIFAVLPTFVVTDVFAQTCVTQPDCKELGYTQSPTDCDGKNMIHCFFDTSKVFCGGTICNYTSTALPANCEAADSCISGTTTYYNDVCSKCNDGYELSNGACVSTCNYTLTTSPANCSTVDSCKKNGTTYYACLSCKTGYDVKDGTCCENSCKGSWYDTSCNGSVSIGSSDGCGNTCYYCECRDNFEVLSVINSRCVDYGQSVYKCLCDLNSTSSKCGDKSFATVHDVYNTNAACVSVCVGSCSTYVGTYRSLSTEYLIK